MIYFGLKLAKYAERCISVHFLNGNIKSSTRRLGYAFRLISVPVKIIHSNTYADNRTVRLIDVMPINEWALA